MKVLFVGRSTLFSHHGGDTTQMVQTAEYLKKLEVQVAIQTADQPIPKGFDLIHFFNLIRPGDILKYLKMDIPLVVSPIYVDYSLFDKNDRSGIQKWLSKTFSKHSIEYMKCIIRWLKGQDKMYDYSYLFGHKRAMERVLHRASLLLPNSESEVGRIKFDLGNNFKYQVVPNSINKEIFYPEPNIQRKSNLVMCVGQFDGRKNQLRLIQACQELDVELILVGNASPNNAAYLEKCKKAAGTNVQFLDFTSQDKLRTLYSEATVHVLPAWFETTGLTSLEAAACGCKIVVSNAGDTADYFSDIAWFCEPDSTQSIGKAIQEALASPNKNALAKIHKEYTWEITAEKTLSAYLSIIK